eukprot:6954576-Prymnesium_polylepis.1
MSGSSVNCAASASLAIVPISECAMLRRRVVSVSEVSLQYPVPTPTPSNEARVLRAARACCCALTRWPDATCTNHGARPRCCWLRLHPCTAPRRPPSRSSATGCSSDAADSQPTAAAAAAAATTTTTLVGAAAAAAAARARHQRSPPF